MEFIRISVTAVILLCAVQSDFAVGKIRNRLILTGLFLGLLLHLPGIDAEELCSMLMGIAVPVLVCWIPFRMHGLGAGDVKLFCVIGCLNGGRSIVYCICISFLLAAGFSVGRLLTQKQLWSSMYGCIRYFQLIVREGKIIPYPERARPGHQFHFSAAVLLGYAAVLGVKVCGFIP